MKSFKTIRAQLDEFRLGDNPTTQNPSDKAFLNKHLVLQYKNLSVPVSDDKVFKATNVDFRGGSNSKRPADLNAQENQMDGYNAPVLFGDYVNYLMKMKAANESVELDSEESALIESVLGYEDQDELKALLDTELTEDFEYDLTEAPHHIPLKGHAYHKKPDSHLHYIIKDAGEAAKAMQGHNEKAESKYLDQVNDAHTVLGYRKRHGHSIGYHNGKPVKEETELQEVSKKTLGSYIKKSREDELEAHRSDASTAGETGNYGTSSSERRRMKNRATGIDRAVNKLTKEDVELDEMTSMQIKKVWEKAAKAKAQKSSAARDAFRQADQKKLKKVEEATSPVPQIKAKKSFSDYVKKSDDNLKSTDKAIVDGAKAIDDTFATIKKGIK